MEKTSCVMNFTLLNAQYGVPRGAAAIAPTRQFVTEVNRLLIAINDARQAGAGTIDGSEDVEDAEAVLSAQIERVEQLAEDLRILLESIAPSVGAQGTRYTYLPGDFIPGSMTLPSPASACGPLICLY
jgi:hypothetical protein